MSWGKQNKIKKGILKLPGVRTCEVKPGDMFNWNIKELKRIQKTPNENSWKYPGLIRLSPTPYITKEITELHDKAREIYNKEKKRKGDKSPKFDIALYNKIFQNLRKQMKNK